MKREREETQQKKILYKGFPRFFQIQHSLDKNACSFLLDAQSVLENSVLITCINTVQEVDKDLIELCSVAESVFLVKIFPSKEFM